MNDFIEVLKNYWQIILTGIFLVLSFILQLVKKSKVKIYDDSAMANLIEFVNEAESVYGAGHGKDKLLYVFNKYCDLHHIEKTGLYFNAIKSIVEAILSTPQKKD